MSKWKQRILAGVMAVFLCVLGAVAGWTAFRPVAVDADQVTKVDGMIFWGTSGVAQMYKLINTEEYAVTRKLSDTEVQQHLWASDLNEARIGYGKFADSNYMEATDNQYAVLQDWYPGWSATDENVYSWATITGQDDDGSEFRFSNTASPTNPQRKPQVFESAANTNIGSQVMDQLAIAESRGWGSDNESEGGNENGDKGDGIAIVIWAGEDWVVRNWDSSDLGFVGQEDGQRNSNMDTYSTDSVLLKYWMGLSCESGTGTHTYDPAPWANEMDDGSVMHQWTKDDGVSGDEQAAEAAASGTAGVGWQNDGTFKAAGSVANRQNLSTVHGHVGDQEVGVTTCNDQIYPSIGSSNGGGSPRLNDIKTTTELDQGEFGKGSSSTLITSPYGTSYAYSEHSDNGTQASESEPGAKNIRPAGNSTQVSDYYTTQWIEADNGYQDFENSGFSYNAVDDGITIDLSTHKLTETTDPIGDGYSNGNKESLATQCGTLFARVLSGYDYEVEYLTQDQDPSAIPHNTDDTQLDDWYEVTYLHVSQNVCSHVNPICGCNCEGYTVCQSSPGYVVSVQMIRVRSRCDTESGSEEPMVQQGLGKADQGYADSYHIHVLGGVGMYDVFPVDDDLYAIPNDTYTVSHNTAENCGVSADGFTGHYEKREDNAYEMSSAVDPVSGFVHNCWEHLPEFGSYLDVDDDLPNCNAYSDQPSVKPSGGNKPWMPQKLKGESEQNGVFTGESFDFCRDHTQTGDDSPECDGCCCCCNHAAVPPVHCNGKCRGYKLEWLCPYLRVMPVTEVAGFDGRKHNVIPTWIKSYDGSGWVYLNNYNTQFKEAAYAAAAQRFLRTWGDDSGKRQSPAGYNFEQYIYPSIKTWETRTYQGGNYPYGMIKYGEATNPPSKTGSLASRVPNAVNEGNHQYQEGSNFVNTDNDSHVYIRTWYTNPNKPIMKYVTETRHVNGYIESWLAAYPDAKVYVFGLGPYSKATTTDTMDENWTAAHDIMSDTYWEDEFGRDTNYDGVINGLDRVKSNNKNSMKVDEGDSDNNNGKGEGPNLTQLVETPVKGSYTDSEGAYGVNDSMADRNQAIKDEYLIRKPEDRLDTPTVTPDSSVTPLLPDWNSRSAGSDTYYADGSWLDLATYGGTIPEGDKYLDEIARTERIDNARKQYNEALKTNLKNATYVDIWDLVLEHEPYFQYASMTDSAAVSTSSGGAANAVNAYHGKYYDQTTYSWIFHMMWATVLNDNPEDQPAEAIESNLYDLASALTAYANTVLSPKGRSNTGGTGGAAEAADGSVDDMSHKLPDLIETGFFGAGAALGYGDSAYGFTSALLVPFSNSSSTVDYQSLINVEMGESAPDKSKNGAMYVYARYGRLLQDMGIDETGMESSVSPRMAPGLITCLGYVGNAALGVVWNLAFEVLDLLNPFRFLVGTTGHQTDNVAVGTTVTDGAASDGVTMTDPFESGATAHGNVETGSVTAPQIEGINNDGVPSAMKPLINYVTDIYMLLRGVGLWVVLPLLLVLFFASVLMLRHDWKSAASKFLVPFVFIVVGIPILGAMYTSVVHDCKELVSMASSPSSQLVAATFVDFQGWVERDRLAPPLDATAAGTSVELISEGNGGGSASGQASGETLQNLRKIAWSINKETNVIPDMNDVNSVFNDSTVTTALTNQEDWDEVVVNSYDTSKSYGVTDWAKDWKAAMAASADIMQMLWKYTNGEFYFASDFNSATMSHFSQNYPGLVGSRKGAGAVTDSGSASDADEFTSDGTAITPAATTYNEADNKYKLYGLFSSASHGDAWLNRTAEENRDLLIGAERDVSGDNGGENFTGFNPFANGRIAATGDSITNGVNGATTITFKRDTAATNFSTNPSDANWAQKSGLDWKSNGGLSTVAMYNYLATDFDETAVKVYSSRNVVNLHQEKAHYAVNTIGSGFTGTMYWLNCVVYMLACCVIGFVYALGMAVQNIKNGLQMIMKLPAAMLGVRKSIVGVCAIVVSLIFQVISSVVLYQLVAGVAMTLVTMVDGISRTAFANITAAQIGGVLAQWYETIAPSAIQGSFASQLMYMCGITMALTGVSIAACVMAPVWYRIADMIFDYIMVRWMLPKGVMGEYLAYKAELRAANTKRVKNKVRSSADRRVIDTIPTENTGCQMGGQVL